MNLHWSLMTSRACLSVGHLKRPQSSLFPNVRILMRYPGPLANETQYRNSGRTEWRRLSNVLTEVKPHYNRVLDWGVGCARIIQHNNETAVSVTGNH